MLLSHHTTLHHRTPHRRQPSTIQASINDDDNNDHNHLHRRRSIVTLATTTALLLGHCPNPAVASQSWGTHSFIKERFFQPDLSPEEAVARIKQTAEGLHDMRHMLDTMSWRYVLFYIRLKSAYLSDDLKSAFTTMPEGQRGKYVVVANELMDNMSELDRFVRTPKVYESYLYYEKTLKSIDDLVAMLA
ncbi:hypothetical protein QJS04_geneDACA019452 [Acorus gramineus]|uniref:Photosynthetic NDH subcomplex L 2 n=1 Tax=Acorus gramineus TaxID=55184 RepID=A0AAV9AB66_ACOGR|nr:hypothetical protein QJS04_geneDACA019452 [Acorus gramineus]